MTRNGRHGVASGAEVFASEIREAKLLGFQLQLAESPGTITVRLVPQTPRGRAIAKASGVPDASAIEAQVGVPKGSGPTDRLDAIRDTIRTALALARDTGA